jgi:hypothetical protein
MKQAALAFALIFAMTNIGAANAQSAGKIVAPATSTESSRVISGAVSDSAKDAIKADKKAEEMKEKAKKMEADVKKGKQ